MAGVPTTAAVFLAGIVTILTPCCLPMIPVLVVGGTGHRLRPVAIVSGSTLMFTILGVATGMIGALTPDDIRAPFAILMVAFGAVMADDDLNELYSRYTRKFVSSANSATRVVDEERHPLANAFVVGLLLGVIWLPCVGPVLGGVLAFVGTTGDITQSALLLFTYGVGFSIPLLGVAYATKFGGRQVLGPVLDDGLTEHVQTITGYSFVAFGVAMLFGLDKLALASLIELL